MLDTETKRRIDEARDILVGKLPDPKSQVEQITIALIYKFMYDMDKEALDFGGQATFFSGEWEKYSWVNIFDPKIGGYEMLNLYGEAIVKLNQNPNIPQLFRDIFKNAYLPYRDPETLKLFLKTINGFHYDHSERLGDAFEYLLSVLGSQGDAGQFRTPRHIIDFIVAVLQPKKNETICDPACGTAGFLISAYKYIVNQNSKTKQVGTKDDHGNPLIKEIMVQTITPDERKKMMERFTGYDISPDMVRLSLVNMYLHNFTTPKIYEYDTLTSEERWNESFDIIMANPPFMSPKGGIKPHKKFTMQANRSEVLFVDYIAEHINPATGRAGIIVPEGIIFQSANAYKQLRQLLVDKKFLYAVVSLPAGIFQPYSGVKTSILLLDKTLAKKTDNILFVKIENDGFDLGAQRRVIYKNDLTAGLIHLEEYKESILNNTEFISDNKNAFAVDKKVIKGTGDYNLSVDRYRTNESVKTSNFEMVRIGDIVEILDILRKPITKSERKAGRYPYYGATGIVDYVDDYIFDDRLILVGEDGAKWNSGDKTAFIAEGKYWVNNHAHVIRPKHDRLLDVFLVELLNIMDLNKYITGVTVPKLNQEKLRSIEIPLPPLSIQQKIVDKIESYQAIINGSKQVVENYKPQIDIDPDWEMVALGEVLSFIGSGATPLGGKEVYIEKGILFIRSQNILWGECDFSDAVFIEATIHSEMKRSMVKKDDVLLNITGASIGRCAIFLEDREANVNQHVTILRTKNLLVPTFLMYCIIDKNFQNKIWSIQSGASRQALNYQQIRQLEIPLPSVLEQQQIVNRIAQEQQLVNANKELIKIYDQKVKDEINKLWKPAVKEYEVKEERVSLAAEE